MRRHDLTGQRYGRLVVLKEIPERKRGEIQYLCQCDCGNQTIVPSYSLRSGNTQSCGCLKIETSANTFRNLGDRRYHKKSNNGASIGSRYGKLVVIDEDGRKCVCKCDCGRIITCYKNSLYRGMDSCGCGNGFYRQRRLIFEEVTGQKTPAGTTIISLNGNKQDFNKDNLMAISNAAYLQMLRGNLFSNDPELTKTAALACELAHTTRLVMRNTKE